MVKNSSILLVFTVIMIKTWSKPDESIIQLYVK
jgi:hypothetical protein